MVTVLGNALGNNFVPVSENSNFGSSNYRMFTPDKKRYPIDFTITPFHLILCLLLDVKICWTEVDKVIIINTSIHRE